MIRAGFSRQHVLCTPEMARLQLFLQFGFKIFQLSIGAPDIFDLGFEKRQHDAPRLLDTAVQVYRAEDSFESINLQRLFGSASGLLFAFAQLQIGAQTDTFRIFDQIGRADEEALELGELSLVQVRMRAIQKIADKKSEHRVAEKLQLLVIV